RTPQRHVVRPADDRTDPAEGRVHGVERRPVAEAPDEPLRTRGHELPVRPGDPGAGVEHECGAVEGVAEALDDADDDEDLELSGGAGQALDFRSVQRDRAGTVAPVLPAPSVSARSHGGAAPPSIPLASQDALERASKIA